MLSPFSPAQVDEGCRSKQAQRSNPAQQYASKTVLSEDVCENYTKDNERGDYQQTLRVLHAAGTESGRRHSQSLPTSTSNSRRPCPIPIMLRPQDIRPTTTA